MLIRKLLDFFDDIVRRGEAFLGNVNQAAAAANNSHVQLKNPGGSAVFVYLDKLTIFGLSAATTFRFNTFDTDLTTNDTTSLNNKKLGGAAPVAQTRKQNNATQLGSAAMAFKGEANIDRVLTFSPPLRLAAGKGVVVVGDTQNQGIDVTFEWRERAV